MSYINVDTELYKVFYITAKLGSISAAAKELYVSQPAVSKAVKKLEEQTGCALFLRLPRGVKLTSEGQLLYESVRQAFFHLESAQKNISRLTGKNSGSVSVGVSNTLCRYFFMPYLESFHEAYPQIRVKIINVPSPMTHEMLDEGSIDFGVVSISGENTRYDYKELLVVEDIFITSKKETAELITDFKSLEQCHVMMMEKGNYTRDYVDAFFAAKGIELKPEIEIGSMDFLVEFAKIGIGCSCVIKQFVKDELDEGALFEMNFGQRLPKRCIGIVTAKNTVFTNAAKAFIQLLTD